MIFNSEYTSSYDNMVVTESPYPLGLEGALMHVWENECNYNAMMKAVGISELRYYQETGGDLFVQEAGAFGSFISKAKAFFKKVIEKIKQIFHKFMAVINQYTMSDKDFVKKYQKELYRRDLTDFEFTGYTFKDLESNATTVGSNCEKTALKVISAERDATFDHLTDRPNRAIGAPEHGKYTNDNIDTATNAYDNIKDSDKITELKEKYRGELLGKSGSYDEAELREEFKEMLYGDSDKETFDVKSIREWVVYITNTAKDVKDAEKTQKTITKAIDHFIKDAETFQNTYSKISDDEKKAGTEGETARTQKNENIKKLNYHLDICRSLSNDFTVIFGMITQALKDRNRQAKAICVKALSYKNKNESATYTESYYDNDDIFANVVIR